jgi:hypothetical protein
MSIILTQEEQDYLNRSFNGYTIDETYTTPVQGADEDISEFVLPTNRKIHVIYHYNTDSLTVFSVDETPPPIEITKINNLIETNEQFRSLLNN